MTNGGLLYHYFWLVTVTNLCHSDKFSLSNQQITFYSALYVQFYCNMHNDWCIVP